MISDDPLGKFTERIGEDIKDFGEKTGKKDIVCRKKMLGEMFSCECEQCKEKIK